MGNTENQENEDLVIKNVLCAICFDAKKPHPKGCGYTVKKVSAEQPGKSNPATCASDLVFHQAQADEKQYFLSGLRPENREIFSNPQSSSYSMKI